MRPRLSTAILNAPLRRLGGSVAALMLLGVLVAGWRVSDASWIRFLILGTLALASWRPWDGLLVLAGLGPVIGVYGAAHGAPVSTRELLVVAACAGWSLRVAFGRSRGALLPADIAWPLFAAAGVVATSLIVELHGQRALVGPAAFAGTLRYIVELGLLRERHGLRGLSAGLTYLEGLAIFAAAVALCRTRREALGQAVAMTVAGATGAALLNIQRIVVAAQTAAAPLERLRELFWTVRVNVGYGDVNAAGSYFALLFFPACAQAFRSSRWRRGLWAGAGATIFAAAWLTGSRAAVAAILVVSLVATMIMAGSRAWRMRAVAAAAVASLVAIGAFVAVFPNPVLGSATPVAVEIRLEMARISLGMLGEQPLFGVGVGGFAEASVPRLASSTIAAHYSRENAHNHLLQWLAELGLVGFGTLLWLVWRATLRIAGSLAGPGQATLVGLAAGLVAFALTAMLGHPLLTPEVNHAFWLLLGLACGVATPRVVTRRASRAARASALVVIGLTCALLPWRFRDEAARLPLEHVRHGVSPWHVDTDGLRYQTFRIVATVFVPATARAVDIPLQLAEGGMPALLEIRFRNRVADRITIVPGAWQTYRLVVAGQRNDPPYLPVEIRVMDGEQRHVRIARTIVR